MHTYRHKLTRSLTFIACTVLCNSLALIRRLETLDSYSIYLYVYYTYIDVREYLVFILKFPPTIRFLTARKQLTINSER